MLNKLEGYFTLANVNGSADVVMTWKYLEDMLLKAKGKYQNPLYASSSQVALFYKNIGKNFSELNTGCDLIIDRLWQ